MSKRNPPLLDYKVANLQKVSRSIRQNLDSSLPPKKWIEHNQKNPMFGHCHTVSGVLYRIFGSENLSMFRAFDESCAIVDEPMYHWWVIDKNGKRIDLTSSQYRNYRDLLESLYDRGERASLLGFGYRRRVEVLLDRVKVSL